LWKVAGPKDEESVKPLETKFLPIFFHILTFLRMVVDWLKENNVLTNICKSSGHPEVIKQSIPILIFMSKLGHLESQHLEMIFESSLVLPRVLCVIINLRENMSR
jgi:hypothetical protein